MSGTKNLVIRKIGVKMKFVYVVKTFGPQNGYVNMRAFDTIEKAESYAEVLGSQIPPEVKDEFVEVEELSLE